MIHRAYRSVITCYFPNPNTTFFLLGRKGWPSSEWASSECAKQTLFPVPVPSHVSMTQWTMPAEASASKILLCLFIDGRKDMFYLTMHSALLFMTQIVRKKTRCRQVMSYSFSTGRGGGGGGGGGVGGGLLLCPYSLKFQACPPRYQRPALQSRVSGQTFFSISSKGSSICTIPQTEKHTPRPLLHQSWSTGWNEK